MNRQEIIERLAEIKERRQQILSQGAIPVKLKQTLKVEQASYDLAEGISIIIPTYKGADVITKCLASIANQTLSQSLFEVLIIMNGEKDNTEEVVKNFATREKLNNIKLYHLEEAGASVARNKGIDLASRMYTVFVDDDDYISPNFLEGLLKYATEETVSISQIIDVNQNGVENAENSVNKQLIASQGKEANAFHELSMVLTVNACKLIPTKHVKEVRYDTRLKSGEDIVYFTELFTKNNMHFKVVPAKENVIYYRYLRENSVSRRQMSFQFNVKERLDVIDNLNRLLLRADQTAKSTFIRQKIRAQSSFINRFLQENPHQATIVTTEIQKHDLSYFPYDVVNKGVAKTLVVSYCFPPYVDTSGNVMAKRICAKNEVVDVIYNKMDKVRKQDPLLNKMVEHVIENRIEVPTYSSFSNWKAIKDFSTQALEKVQGIERQKGPYKKMYSRVMWPGSHFMAFEYKIKNPNVNWTAEFSDPILFDIYGKERNAVMDDPDFLKRVHKLLRKKKLPVIESNNLFFWCEYLAYVFADELIFTNEHQLKYMLDVFPVNQIKGLIKRKAKVVSQPTLPDRYYHLVESDYVIDDSKANVAYFGSFYGTRKLNELFDGIQNVNPAFRKKLKLHIFTSDPGTLQKELEGSPIQDNIQVNDYVSFYEFLNLTTRFDCLVGNDAMTKEYKEINPYLPSKLSDYIGSGNDVWGIYEEGSILSGYPLKYKSRIGDVEGATTVFEQIVRNKEAALQSS